jgi:hypothetical protein
MHMMVMSDRVMTRAEVSDHVRRLLMNAAVDLMPAFAREMHSLSRPMISPVVRGATFGIAQTVRWAFAGEQYRKSH